MFMISSVGVDEAVLVSKCLFKTMGLFCLQFVSGLSLSQRTFERELRFQFHSGERML